jgi:hypothetical protein
MSSSSRIQLCDSPRKYFLHTRIKLSPLWSYETLTARLTVLIRVIIVKRVFSVIFYTCLYLYGLLIKTVLSIRLYIWSSSRMDKSILMKFGIGLFRENISNYQLSTVSLHKIINIFGLICGTRLLSVHCILYSRPGKIFADQELLLISTESRGPHILIFLVVYGKPQDIYSNNILILVIRSKQNQIS